MIWQRRNFGQNGMTKINRAILTEKETGLIKSKKYIHQWEKN